MKEEAKKLTAHSLGVISLLITAIASTLMVSKFCPDQGTDGMVVLLIKGLPAMLEVGTIVWEFHWLNKREGQLMHKLLVNLKKYAK
jgi:hypothetical protein